MHPTEGLSRKEKAKLERFFSSRYGTGELVETDEEESTDFEPSSSPKRRSRSESEASWYEYHPSRWLDELVRGVDQSADVVDAKSSKQ